ncbi:MAG: hypothetical protein JW839_14170 [Candidatus Lokiarchaeota archaeon]|nr:hypothetical protein [Candidatus Lokiarchaeota archaeon]
MNRSHPSASRIKIAVILAALFAVVVCSTLTTRASSISVCDDAYEDNDNTGSAYPVSSGTYPNLVLEDSNDYYSIMLPNRDHIQVTIMFSHSICDIDMQLLSSYGSYVTGSTGTSDSELMTYTSTSSQTMYIRIYTGGSPSPSAIYSMIISVTSPPAVPGYDALLLVVALVSTAGVLALVIRKRRM